MRIKFINLQPHRESSGAITTMPAHTGSGVGIIRLNAVYYFLKSFYKNNGKYYSDYTWLPSEHGWDTRTDLEGNIIDYDTICNTIKEEKTDIICMSLYIWNYVPSMILVNKIRQAIPNIKIIGGGPGIEYDYLYHDINQNNKDYVIQFDRLGIIDNPINELAEFKKIKTKYYNFDYLVYDDGEEAFQMLLDSFYEPIDERTIPNLITKDFVTPHKVFKFEKYKPYSAYLDLKEDFIQDYNIALDTITKNKSKKNLLVPEEEILVTYEIMRGCPYACTFCSDRIGRVSKKRLGRIWEDEILFFSKFKYVSIHLVDANAGMTQEYVDFFRFGSQFTNKHFKIIPGNFAKLNKNKCYEIMSLMEDTTIRYAMQNIDGSILENVNRPDITWDQHKIQILKIKNELNKVIVMELIHGLPGTKVNNFLYQLREFIKLPVALLRLYWWELLVNSIAYSKEYQEKHNLKIIDSITLTKDIKGSIDNLYHDVNNNDFIEGTIRTNIVYENIDMKEYFIIMYLSILYNMLSNNFRLYDVQDSDTRLNKFNECIEVAWPYIDKLSEKYKIMFEEKVSEFGFFIWGDNPKSAHPSYIDNVEINLPIQSIIEGHCKFLFAKKFSSIIGTPVDFAREFTP